MTIKQATKATFLSLLFIFLGTFANTFLSMWLDQHTFELALLRHYARLSLGTAITTGVVYLLHSPLENKLVQIKDGESKGDK